MEDPRRAVAPTIVVDPNLKLCRDALLSRLSWLCQKRFAILRHLRMRLICHRIECIEKVIKG